MNEKYYLVETMCGHVGNGAYIPVTFPIRAEDGKSAAKIAREIPRVKHHNKYAILDVKKVDFEEFDQQRKINRHDSYLNWLKVNYEVYQEEVSNRVILMESRQHYPKKKRHASLNNKKNTTKKLCLNELLDEINDLFDNSLMRTCRIS